ncbi:hypothetical protein [Novipirellula artificiosorum]|nr:hypothetical protein [Novipirellula artificiosorum]
MSTVERLIDDHTDLDPITADTLDEFARRRRWLVAIRCFAVAVLAFFSSILVVALCDYLWLVPGYARFLLSLAAYAFTATMLWFFGLRYLRRPSPSDLARQFEATEPRVRDDLLSAVELADPQFANGSAQLRDRLQSIVARRLLLLDIKKLLPMQLVRRWLLVGGGVFAVCFLLMSVPSLQFSRRLARAALPIAAIERASQTRVTILEPSPPSRYVAQGDAVAIVVQIGGRTTNEVTLQWETEDDSFDAPMLSRQSRLRSITSTTDASTQNREQGATETEGNSNRNAQFAANVGVGSSEVRYRVLAGDAVTLWHTLKPLPRPRVTRFEKRYEFPSYTKIEDVLETSEHGDLKSLAGTTAHLTVHFDQPVRDASFRFGNRGVIVELESLDSSNQTFTGSLPIKTPAQYQVDAISIESELDNPFSPQYTITPVMDSPPIVRWKEPTPSTMLVSPLDVLTFAASVQDDVPIDQVQQEYSVNAGLFTEQRLAVSEAAMALTVEWKWDLLHRDDPIQESEKFKHGDLIQFRLAAMDRRGQRGVSSLVQILILDETFDKDRHARVDALHDLVKQTIAWANSGKQLASQGLLPSGRQPTKDALIDGETDAKPFDQWRQSKEALLGNLKTALLGSVHDAEATNLELLGRAVIDLESKFRLATFQSKQEASQSDERSEKRRTDLAGQPKRISNELTRLENLARYLLAQQVAVGTLTDVASLYQSLLPIVDDETSISTKRLPRYVKLAQARLESIDRFIDQYREELPDFTLDRLGTWFDHSDSWQIQFRHALSNPPGDENLRALVKDFLEQLEDRRDDSIIDGDLSSRLRNEIRDVNRQIASTRDLVNRFNEAGRESMSASDQIKLSDDAEQIAVLSRKANQERELYQFQLTDYLSRLEQNERLHRSRPNVDLPYAADSELMQRALKNVNENGFVDYRGNALAPIHDELAKAFALIQSVHDAKIWHDELSLLLAAERRLAAYADARIEHPHWIERIRIGLEDGSQRMRHNGVDPSLAEAVNRIRNSGAYNQANHQITQRRWSGDPPLSAELWLNTIADDLAEAVKDLEPAAVNARDTIMRYVPTLAEQARRAAEQAAEAKQRTDDRPDDSPQTVQQLSSEQQAAEQAAAETMQALADRANRTDMTETSERELARDADAASAQIGDALQQAEQSMAAAQQSPQDTQRHQNLDKASAALEQLKRSLEQTAEHFERADAGEDVTRSRQTIREAADALQSDQELQQKFDQAEAMAKTASSSPEELLKRLEDELKRNVPMQEELSGIAEQAVQNAARTLGNAAQQEKTLNNEFEKSDPLLRERKTRMQQRLEALASRLGTVQDALLNRADRATAMAKQDALRRRVIDARETLQQTTQTMRRETSGDRLLSEIEQAALEASDAIDATRETMAGIKEQAQESAAEPVHERPEARDRAERDAKQVQTESRNQRSREAQNEASRWSRHQNDARRRISDTQREQREAKQSIQNSQKQLEKNSDNPWHRDELVRANQRLQQAEDAEQAARESQDFAKQMQLDADRRKREIEQQRIEPLPSENPPAEVAARLVDQVEEELAEIQDEIATIATQAEDIDSFRVSTPSATSAQQQQAFITEQTEAVTEQLARAARHEGRLEKPEMQQRLRQAAESVKTNAVASSEKAEASIAAAAQDAEASPIADRQIAETTQKLQAEADQLSAMGSPTEAQSQDAAQGMKTSSDDTLQQRARQLAETLDDLDRSLFAQNSQADNSQNGQPQQAQNGQSSQQGDSSGEGQPGQQPSAADKSQTLASAMNQQNQQLARERQRQIDASSLSSAQDRDSNAARQSSPLPDPTTRSTSTTIAGDSGMLDARGVDRQGTPWGQLRERRTDDAIESEASLGPPEYQSQIEAYFKAVAQRAAAQE